MAERKGTAGPATGVINSGTFDGRPEARFLLRRGEQALQIEGSLTATRGWFTAAHDRAEAIGRSENNQCLQPAGGSTDQGVAIVQEPCNGGRAQQWRKST